MANLHRNEAAKLLAGLVNALSASVFTVGVFTPLAIRIYGSGELKMADAQVVSITLACTVAGVILHLVGQLVLWTMRDSS